MTLKAKVKDINEVPEAFRGEYVQQGEEWVVDIEGGLKTNEDVSRLTGALTKERNDHAQTRSKLKPFEGLNLEEVQTQLARIPELEIAAEGKIDDKKLDKLVEARLQSKVAPIQRQLEIANTKLAEKDQVITGFQTKEKTRTIHDTVRAAATKAGVRPTALEDVLVLSERVFDLDQNNAPVVKEGMGMTPGLDPASWIADMQSKRPHWWPESEGGGATGSKGNGRGEVNPFTHENWNLTAQGELLKKDRGRAEQMARAAGTEIGGRKPPPKK